VTITSDGSSAPAGSLEVGNFTITSALEVIDTFATSAILFNASPVSVNDSTPDNLIVTGDLLISGALSNALVGNDSLIGLDAGDFRVAGVPEPSSLLLSGVAGLLLFGRRRRS
jgi:hypothetical protein